ncbi:MAG: YdcF family protein [bacterium]
MYKHRKLFVGFLPTMKKVLFLAALAVAISVCAYIGWIAWRIERQSTRDEARSADVILIMGAAEYRGKPSPVLKARLDHGLELYRNKLATRILTTGGAGGDPVFTEGEVGREYLIRQGVPSEAILVESEGSSTVHSTSAAAEIMRRMGLRSCIVVSDGYHIFRAKKMLEARGFHVYGSPRPEKHARPKDWWVYVRQAVGYVLWSVGVTI